MVHEVRCFLHVCIGMSLLLLLIYLDTSPVRMTASSFIAMDVHPSCTGVKIGAHCWLKSQPRRRPPSCSCPSSFVNLPWTIRIT